MTAATPELLIAVAVLILVAVAVGSFAGRLFMAASRPGTSKKEQHRLRP
ncbi:MAG TPA: hypothetical protein VFA25_00660 [Actinomycetota bacterium]|jgi:hypothetical protein|nr:hypothetical protein [Actinomycetota bacterium]